MTRTNQPQGSCTSLAKQEARQKRHGPAKCYTILESQLCNCIKKEVSDASLPQIDWIHSDKSVKCVCLQARISDGDIFKMRFNAESNFLFENCKCLYRENERLRNGATVASASLYKSIKPLYVQELYVVIFLIIFQSELMYNDNS